jgi:hypothetical protein
VAERRWRTETQAFALLGSDLLSGGLLLGFFLLFVQVVQLR